MKILVSLLLASFIGVTLHAQSASPVGSGTSGPQVSGNYVISPLDTLRVRLFVADEPQFETELRVASDGSVTLPHLGLVNLKDKTLEESRVHLYELYNRDYYVNPHLDMVVLAYNQRSVTVIGQVNAQGQVPFPSEEALYLLEAIALAGGWKANDLADTKRVKIIREEANGNMREIVVDARSLSARDMPLQDGDTIEVPRRIW